MVVKKIGEKYRCSVCGNEVTVTKVGGGTLWKKYEENWRIGGIK
jgi:desulfoferrodoxin-like iron-binding protein